MQARWPIASRARPDEDSNTPAEVIGGIAIGGPAESPRAVSVSLKTTAKARPGFNPMSSRPVERTTVLGQGTGKMKVLLIVSLSLISSSAMAAGCVKGAQGQTVCRGASGAVVAAPASHSTTVVTGQSYRHGVTTAQGAYGGKAAYNPNTGNAAVSQRNANGVATTRTSRGGEAKTKNGMGVVQGAGGTTCVKGRGQARCN